MPQKSRGVALWVRKKARRAPGFQRTECVRIAGVGAEARVAGTSAAPSGSRGGGRRGVPCNSVLREKTQLRQALDVSLESGGRGGRHSTQQSLGARGDKLETGAIAELQDHDALVTCTQALADHPADRFADD